VFFALFFVTPYNMFLDKRNIDFSLHVCCFDASPSGKMKCTESICCLDVDTSSPFDQQCYSFKVIVSGSKLEIEEMFRQDSN